jgi:hypothetical protein
MVYYLLFFELQIKRYEFPKFGLNSGLKTKFEFYLDQSRPRV